MVRSIQISGYEDWSSEKKRKIDKAVELVAHHAPELLVVVEDLGELGDPRLELVPLGLELDPAELGEAAQRHVEDVGGLSVAEVEDLHEPCLRGRRVVG